MERETTNPYGGDQLPQPSAGPESDQELPLAPGTEAEQTASSRPAEPPEQASTDGTPTQPATVPGAKPDQFESAAGVGTGQTARAVGESLERAGQEQTLAVVPATPEHPPHSPNRIHVASLMDYTHGVLHGVWIDAGQDVEAMQAEVQRMLADSPTAAETGEVAEEYAIHDYDGEAFSRLPIGEYERLSDVARIAELANEHGEPFIVLAQHAGLDDLDFLETAMRDSYLGHWTSVEDYAEQYFDDIGAKMFVENAPEYIRPYLMLDTGKLAEEMESVMTILDGQGGVYVFDPNC